MKTGKNRKTEKAGVNAAKTFFEDQGCVFQEVHLENDFGKDAYVDIGSGERLSGVCVALQIKSGRKYKRANGYAIPIENHADVWRKSTIPIAGVVFDITTRKLFWCDITTFMLDRKGGVSTHIPVSLENELNAQTLHNGFAQHFFSLSLERTTEKAVLNLCSTDPEVQRLAFLDCLIFGRTDVRVFIILRHLIPTFRRRTMQTAIWTLANAAQVAEVPVSGSDWVPEEITMALKTQFRWTSKEICQMLNAVPWNRWQRGNVGQDLYMLLSCDPRHREKMAKVAIVAARRGWKRVAWVALYLTVYWAGREGGQKYQELLETEPAFRNLTLTPELEDSLGENGCVPLF